MFYYGAAVPVQQSESLLRALCCTYKEVKIQKQTNQGSHVQPNLICQPYTVTSYYKRLIKCKTPLPYLRKRTSQPSRLVSTFFLHGDCYNFIKLQTYIHFNEGNKNCRNSFLRIVTYETAEFNYQE